MKYILILFFIGTTYTSFSQETDKVTIEFNNITLKEALKKLEKTYSNVSFTYNSNLKLLNNKITKTYKAKSLNEILDDIIISENLSYRKVGSNIIIYNTEKATSKKSKTVSGYIYDKETGETLVGANIYSIETFKGTSSNSYGFFSISLSDSETNILISYLGYSDEIIQIKVLTTRQNVYLSPEDNQLDEVLIESSNNKIERKYAGALNITPAELKEMPLLLGEPDILKAVQLQNGIKTLSDGSSFYYVRGGNHDQNLVLVDEAPLYNPSHVLGLVSVINGDAIKSSNFYKGYFPAKYSGRLSSVLDITTNDGNIKEFHAKGGISVLGGRLVLEGPIAKNKASFMISGRKSWVDFLLKTNDDAPVPNYYDINAKSHWKVNENNNLYFSFYNGHDDIDAGIVGFLTKWTNRLGTLRWNHIYNDKLFANTSLIYNTFNSLNVGENQKKEWLNGIDEFRLKHQMNYYLNDKNQFDIGFKLGDHAFAPGKFNDNSVDLGQKKIRTYGFFATHQYSLSSSLKLEYGAHFNMVQAIGKARLIDFDDNYNITKVYESGSGAYKTWTGIEPRVNLMYNVDDNNRVFASFSRMQQFTHSLNNTQNDYDIIKTWVPVSNNIDPLRSNIYSLGYNFSKNKLTVNVEGYYKTIENQLDYEAYPLLQNINYERSLRPGEGKSYGAELGLGYQFKKLKLQLDYSYSKTKLTIPGVNNGKSYVAPYDIPHQLTINGLYQFNYRWSISSLWKFSSGRPLTLPIGTQLLNGGSTVVPLFGNKNNARGRNYHKLDFMLTLAPKKSNKKWKGTWNFGVSNVYGRENPLIYAYDINNDETRSYNISFFRFLPTIAYSFKF